MVLKHSFNKLETKDCTKIFNHLSDSDSETSFLSSWRFPKLDQKTLKVTLINRCLLINRAKRNLSKDKTGSHRTKPALSLLFLFNISLNPKPYIIFSKSFTKPNRSLILTIIYICPRSAAIWSTLS